MGGFLSALSWNAPNMDTAYQKLMMEHLGDLRCLKQQCIIIAFADIQRFDQIFRQYSHCTGETANGYMERFHAAMSLAPSVDNVYTEQQLMHLCLDNFHNPGHIYSTQVTQH